MPACFVVPHRGAYGWTPPSQRFTTEDRDSPRRSRSCTEGDGDDTAEDTEVTEAERIASLTSVSFVSSVVKSGSSATVMSSRAVPARTSTDQLESQPVLHAAPSPGVQELRYTPPTIVPPSRCASSHRPERRRALIPRPGSPCRGHWGLFVGSCPLAERHTVVRVALRGSTGLGGRMAGAWRAHGKGAR